MNSIALVGFMGSGKTTTASELAKHYSMQLKIMDSEIERIYGNTIKNIFEKNGESFFRILENEVLSNIVKQKNCIIDTGGGTFIQNNNREILKKYNVKTIFLDVPFELICERLEKEKNARPLLLNNENWIDSAYKLYLKRYEIYKMADSYLKISKSDLVCDVVLKIVKLLGANYVRS